jgi:branched-chain amino acid transport system substrate-binding protein
MKKWLSVAAIVVLCLAMVVGVACGGEEEEEGVKEVKFGIGLPLKGIYGAAVGIPAKQGLELANDYIGEFNVAGERYKWNLIFEDNGYNTQGGMASATKLIYDDGVNFITQLGTEPALAAQQICEESGVILLTSAVPIEALGPDKPHTFLGITFLVANTAAYFKYISEAHPEVKTVSLCFENTELGYLQAEAIATACEYYGMEWLDAEYYPVGTSEFYPIATKMMSKNPDLCYLGMRVLQVMREVGWEGIPFYWAWGSSYGEQYGLENAEGYQIFYPVPLGEGLHEAIRPMAVDYEQRYGAEFTQTAWYYADQLYYMTDALKKAGTVDDVDQIIATLETETFDTTSGPVKFGLKELDGIGHLLILPCSIGEIRGEDYQIVFEMSVYEVDALANEIFGK